MSPSTRPLPQVGDWVRIVALVRNNTHLPLVDCVGVIVTIEEGETQGEEGLVHTVELLDGVGHGILGLEIAHNEDQLIQDQLEVIPKPENLEDEYLIHSPTCPVEARRQMFSVPEQAFVLVQRLIAHAVRLRLHHLSLGKPWGQNRGLSLNQLPAEIQNATSLRHLDLSFTFIEVLPAEIGRLTQLKVLSLKGTKITRLPPEIGQLTQLESLYLSQMSLSSLPPEIWRLTQVKVLRLAKTELATIPPEIGQLTELKVLDLRLTQITSLPPEIGQLTQLEYLDLSFTPLSSLPPEIGQLTQLKDLSLITVKLTSLPPEIGRLAQLKSLSLYRTVLTHLPPEMAALSQLEQLTLDTTSLIVPPPPPAGLDTRQLAEWLKNAFRGDDATPEENTTP